MKTSGALMAVFAPPVFSHSTHTTLFYASRNSDVQLHTVKSIVLFQKLKKELFIMTLVATTSAVLDAQKTR
jgi:hypothetical protein